MSQRNIFSSSLSVIQKHHLADSATILLHNKYFYFTDYITFFKYVYF